MKSEKLTIADLESCGRLLTAKELAELFRVSPLTIYKMARNHRIPGTIRIDTLVRFDPRKVAQAFLK